METWSLWLIAGIVLIIIEIFTPGFVLASFGIGCLLSALFAYFGGGLYIQLIVFSAGTLLVFFTIRPLFMKYVFPHSEQVPTNTAALVGKTAIVLEAIDNDRGSGRVKIGGEDWRAIAADDELIEVNARVQVLKVDGAKVIVKKN